MTLLVRVRVQLFMEYYLAYPLLCIELVFGLSDELVITNVDVGGEHARNSFATSIHASTQQADKHLHLIYNAL